MHKNNKIYWSYIRALTFTGVCLVAFFSFMANAMTITAEMSPEVTSEYNKQLDLQTWPKMHTKLALMDNPYATFYKTIRKKLKKEAITGKRRRLMTHDESIVSAKKKRFDYCQASVSFFVDFAKRAHDLSTLENNPLTKDKLMTGNGVKYPFTDQEANNANFRPAQIALTLGWKYQGKGEQYAEAFLANCLAIPVSLYYKEDSF
ncbi:hypothetical protein [Colwellia psychrerythraea]|uniref:Lipoprotein n=1 Tax=Colwellia psychrerythraea TaxID=28229 RepID=A0A099KRI2_COLPS|nr:hypothetical protein [Colwellia psychrerythraea]KGJ92258.1 hypothetical protein GAB14E_2846 [Colwellia psychrerythraea]